MGDVYRHSCLRIEESRDFEKIRELIYHGDIFHSLVSFNSGDNLVEEGLNDPRKKYYIYYCGYDIAGFVVFLNFTNFSDRPNIYFVDIGILKPFRGKIGFYLSKLMLKVFKEHNNVLDIYCVINTNHKACLFFAKKCGFKVIERDNNFFLLREDYERRC